MTHLEFYTCQHTLQNKDRKHMVLVIDYPTLDEYVKQCLCVGIYTADVTHLQQSEHSILVHLDSKRNISGQIFWRPHHLVNSLRLKCLLCSLQP